MATGGRPHWEAVYGGRAIEALSWFEPAPSLSLELIAAHAPPGGAVLDVGGGASGLAAALVARGYGPVTVCDLSAAALAAARARMGAAAPAVRWVVGDVTDWADPPRVDLWHDRAAFHFLTDPAAQGAYLGTLARALRVGGHAIIATFDADGPETCSGLPVARSSAAGLAARCAALRPGLLTPVAARRHLHVTPGGRTQAFQVSVFRRDGGAETP